MPPGTYTSICTISRSRTKRPGSEAGGDALVQRLHVSGVCALFSGVAHRESAKAGMALALTSEALMQFASEKLPLTSSDELSATSAQCYPFLHSLPRL